MSAALHPSIALLAVWLLAGAAHAGDNLVVNGDAETGDLSGWTDSDGNGYAVTGDAAAVYAGTYSFHGGITGDAGPWVNEIHQDVDVSTLDTQIDAGRVTSSFSAYGRSNGEAGTNDFASVVVEFRDASDVALETYSSGDITPINEWNRVSDERVVPTGTRTIRIRLRGTRPVGASTDAFHDDVTLTLDVETPSEDTSWGHLRSIW